MTPNKERYSYRIAMNSGQVGMYHTIGEMLRVKITKYAGEKHECKIHVEKGKEVVVTTDLHLNDDQIDTIVSGIKDQLRGKGSRDQRRGYGTLCYERGAQQEPASADMNARSAMPSSSPVPPTDEDFLKLIDEHAELETRYGSAQERICHLEGLLGTKDEEIGRLEALLGRRPNETTYIATLAAAFSTDEAIRIQNISDFYQELERMLHPFKVSLKAYAQDGEKAIPSFLDSIQYLKRKEEFDLLQEIRNLRKQHPNRKVILEGNLERELDLLEEEFDTEREKFLGEIKKLSRPQEFTLIVREKEAENDRTYYQILIATPHRKDGVYPPFAQEVIEYARKILSTAGRRQTTEGRGRKTFITPERAGKEDLVSIIAAKDRFAGIDDIRKNLFYQQSETYFCKLGIKMEVISYETTAGKAIVVKEKQPQVKARRAASAADHDELETLRKIIDDLGGRKQYVAKLTITQELNRRLKEELSRADLDRLYRGLFVAGEIMQEGRKVRLTQK